MLYALKRVLKVRKVYSLMRIEDLSNEFLKYHMSDNMDYWIPSNEEDFDYAFRKLAAKLVPIISRPLIVKNKVYSYISSVDGDKRRPIYSLITSEDPSTNPYSGCNTIILGRRVLGSECTGYVLAPQFPKKGIINYIKKSLKNQDMSCLPKDHPDYNNPKGNIKFLEGTQWWIIPASMTSVINDIARISDLTDEIFTYSNARKLHLLYADGIYPREILSLNELEISKALLETTHYDRGLCFLRRIHFFQYIVHLLSDYLNMSPTQVIENYNTESGRQLYATERAKHNELIEEYEKIREEELRDWYESQNVDKKDPYGIDSEMDYIRNNGGDWIYD